MLVNKQDLVDKCQFSNNIEDRLVNPIITDTEQLQIEPVLNEDMYTNLQAIVGGSGNFPELEAFFENYIKQWICFITCYQFYSVHGINVTQYGLRVMNEDTSVPVDPTDRAAFLQHYKNNGQAYLLRMNKSLDKANYTFDGIKYENPCAKKNGNNLIVGRVGAKRTRYFYEERDYRHDL